MTQQEINHYKKVGAELVNRTASARLAWLQHLLLICSTVLGLLVGLHATTSCSLFVRLASALAMLLFAMGIAFGVFALFGRQVVNARQAQAAFFEELLKAHRENREVEPVSAPVARKYVVCETIFYIFSFLAVLCLVARAVATVI